VNKVAEKVIELNDIPGVLECRAIIANKDPYGAVQEEFDYLKGQYVADLQGKFGIDSVEDGGDHIVLHDVDTEEVDRLNDRFSYNLKEIVEG